MVDLVHQQAGGLVGRIRGRLAGLVRRRAEDGESLDPAVGQHQVRALAVRAVEQSRHHGEPAAHGGAVLALEPALVEA